MSLIEELVKKMIADLKCLLVKKVLLRIIILGGYHRAPDSLGMPGYGNQPYAPACGYGVISMMPPPNHYPMHPPTSGGAQAATQAAIIAAAASSSTTRQSPMYSRQHLRQKIYNSYNSAISPVPPGGYYRAPDSLGMPGYGNQPYAPACGYGVISMMPSPNHYPMHPPTSGGAQAATQAAIIAAAASSSTTRQSPMYSRQHLRQKIYNTYNSAISPVPPGMSATSVIQSISSPVPSVITSNASASSSLPEERVETRGEDNSTLPIWTNQDASNFISKTIAELFPYSKTVQPTVPLFGPLYDSDSIPEFTLLQTEPSTSSGQVRILQYPQQHDMQASRYPNQSQIDTQNRSQRNRSQRNQSPTVSSTKSSSKRLNQDEPLTSAESKKKKS